MARPSRAELTIVGAEFALDFRGGGRNLTKASSPGLGSMSPGDDSVIREIRDPALLVARGPRRLTKIVLFPVRLLFSAATGQVGTNALAVEHYLGNARAPATELVGAALDWRIVGPEDSDAATKLLDRELIPLYLHYIDDHTGRLTTLGRSDLTEAFKEWRRRLLA